MFGEDALYHYAPLVISAVALIVALVPNISVPHAYIFISREWLNGQEWTVSRCRWCQRIRRELVSG